MFRDEYFTTQCVTIGEVKVGNNSLVLLRNPHGLQIYLPDLSYDSQTYHPLAFASPSHENTGRTPREVGR